MESDLDLGRIRWTLRHNDRGTTALDADDFLSGYYRASGTRMYSVSADRKLKLELENVLFQPVRIPPFSVRQGFLFFRIDPAAAEDWVRGSTLSAARIRDNHGRLLTLQVLLADAHP